MKLIATIRKVIARHNVASGHRAAHHHQVLAARHDGGVADLLASLSTSPGRGRPRSTAADLAIVHATIEILLKDGYDGLTMAGVAQRAGVSTATVSRVITADWRTA